MSLVFLFSSSFPFSFVRYIHSLSEGESDERAKRTMKGKKRNEIFDKAGEKREKTKQDYDL